MKAKLDNKCGIIDCYKGKEMWFWKFLYDVSTDPDYDTEVIDGIPCETREECQKQWEAIGIKTAA